MSGSEDPTKSTSGAEAYFGFWVKLGKILFGVIPVILLLSAGFAGSINQYLLKVLAVYRSIMSSVLSPFEPLLLSPLHFINGFLGIELKPYPLWRDLCVVLILYTSSHIFHLREVKISRRQKSRAYAVRIVAACIAILLSLALSGFLYHKSTPVELITATCALIGVVIYQPIFAIQFALDVSEKPGNLPENRFLPVFLRKLINALYLFVYSIFLFIFYPFLVSRIGNPLGGFLTILAMLLGVVAFHILPGIIAAWRAPVGGQKFSLVNLNKSGNFYIGWLIFNTLGYALVLLGIGLMAK